MSLNSAFVTKGKRMLKTAILAAALLCALTITSEARQHKRATAQCVEIGSIMHPSCMGQVAAPTDREARRVARGEAAVRVMGFGVVQATRRRRAVRAVLVAQQRAAHVASTIGSGIVRSASGATAHVAGGATGAFQCLVSALDAQGYPVRFMGGWRAHGSVRGSLHPTGMALDINQVARNVTTPRMPSNEVALASGCGLVSGAQWASGDSGHFQIGGWSGARMRHYASRRGRHYVSAAR